MEDVLIGNGLYKPIERDKAKFDDHTDKEWKRINRKVVALFQQWIDNSVFYHVGKEVNAHESWAKLASTYEGKTPLKKKKTFLSRELIHLRYNDGYNMTEHMNDF